MLFTLKIRREELREIQMLQNIPGKFCYDTISRMSIFLIFGEWNIRHSDRSWSRGRVGANRTAWAHVN